MREIQRAREKSRLDMAKKHGIEQGVIRTAEEMLKLGVDIRIITKATKLSLDKIKELEAKLKGNQN